MTTQARRGRPGGPSSVTGGWAGGHLGPTADIGPVRVAVVVIRPVSDAGTTAYRIEHPDGRRTGSGLFVSVEWARRHAAGRGWRVVGEATS